MFENRPQGQVSHKQGMASRRRHDLHRAPVDLEEVVSLAKSGCSAPKPVLPTKERQTAPEPGIARPGSPGCQARSYNRGQTLLIRLRAMAWIKIYSALPGLASQLICRGTVSRPAKSPFGFGKDALLHNCPLSPPRTLKRARLDQGMFPGTCKGQEKEPRHRLLHRIGESHRGHVIRARAALPRRTLDLVHWHYRPDQILDLHISLSTLSPGMSSISYSLHCANASCQSSWPRRKPQKPPARAAAPSPTSSRANTPSISTNAYVHKPARGQCTPMSVL